MKLSFLPLLAAGAGFAVQQVSALTIHVDVVKTGPDGSPVVRYGHAGVDNGNANNAINMAMPAENRRPCPGKLMRDKAISVSNAFRKALGLPLIETSDDAANTDGLIRITPFPFIGTPSKFDVHETKGHPDGVRHVSPIRTHHHMKHHEASFLRRVHHALMALGPWEGRAVAFVLGCGIGVLLRMFWVITIVMYRMIKGERDQAPEYTLVCEHYAEAIQVPPPSYICEKEEGDESAGVDAKNPTGA